MQPTQEPPKHPLLEREKAVIEKEKAIVQRIEARRDRLSERYPLVFTLTAAFGLVATFYGFEAIINQIEVLSNNPIILLATGILALVITGQLYKKLG